MMALDHPSACLWLQREEVNRMQEARQWSPVKTRRQDAAAMAATLVDSEQQAAAAAAAGGGSPAAPAGLAQVATPVAAVAASLHRQQKQQQPHGRRLVPVGMTAAQVEAYDRASALTGSVQRQEAQASAAATAGLPPEPGAAAPELLAA
jgi:hypothetical protein